MAKQMEHLRIAVPGIETLEDLDEYLGSDGLTVIVGGEPAPVIVCYTDDNGNGFATGIAPMGYGYVYLRENCFFRSYDFDDLVSDLIVMEERR